MLGTCLTAVLLSATCADLAEPVASTAIRHQPAAPVVERIGPYLRTVDACALADSGLLGPVCADADGYLLDDSGAVQCLFVASRTESPLRLPMLEQATDAASRVPGPASVALAVAPSGLPGPQQRTGSEPAYRETAPPAPWAQPPVPPA